MKILTKKNLIILIVLVAIAVFVLLFFQYLFLLQKDKINQEIIKSYKHNEKIIDFTKMFIKNVLKSDQVVPLSQVLLLENAARDIDNKIIYDKWQEFVNAKSPAEAQIEVKNLLEILLDRVNY